MKRMKAAVNYDVPWELPGDVHAYEGEEFPFRSAEIPGRCGARAGSVWKVSSDWSKVTCLKCHVLRVREAENRT